MTLMTASRSAMLVLFAALIGACNKPGGEPKNAVNRQPVDITVSDVESALAAAVPNAPIRDFALCHLRSAVWGSYDATVEISAAYTIDKKARSFALKGGQLSVALSDRDLDVRASRAKLVTLSSKEDAFSKGVTFFIDQVQFTAPDNLSFRVWSNPGMKMMSGLPRIENTDRGGSGYTTNVEIVDSHHPVTSNPESKTVTMKENRLDGWVLSLVTTDTQSRCLASNEIDLSSLLKK